MWLGVTSVFGESSSVFTLGLWSNFSSALGWNRDIVEIIGKVYSKNWGFFLVGLGFMEMGEISVSSQSGNFQAW